MAKRFTVQSRAKANASGVHEILIHGPIGKSWWSDEGISGKEVTDALNAIPAGTKIEIGVNSQGGAVGEGLAIYNAIKRRAADVTVRIDGYALSIASVFPLAASRVVSPKSAVWMIHKAWSYSQGNADQMRRDAEMLDAHDRVLTDIYEEHTGQSRGDIEAALTEEKWFSGQEAMDWGLADECTDGDCMLEPMDFARFRNPPAALVAASAASVPFKFLGALARKTTATKPATSGADNHQNTMDKAKILAALRKAGVKVADDATEETILAELGKLVAAGTMTEAQKQELTAKPAAETAPKAGEIADIRAELAELRKTAEAERKGRITAEVNRLIEDRPSQKADAWIEKAVKDETVLDLLRAIPAENIGATPVATAGLVNCGNPLIEAYAKLGERKVLALSSDGVSCREVMSQTVKNARERIAFRKANAVELGLAFNRFMPRAGNTISSTLKPDALVDALVVVANNRLAPLRAFSRLFTPDAMRPGASLAVKKATAGSTGQSNPSSWESGDSTLDVISVTLAHKTQSFQISQSDANYGFSLDDISEINANAFANLLSDVYTAVMTTANYGTAIQVGAAGTFDADDLKPVLAAAKNYRAKNLILDGGHLAYLLPTDKFQFALGEAGAYGFDLIAAQNRWTSAATNAVGFVCAPDALAIAAGAPADQASNQFDMKGTFQIAELGLTVLYTVWFNTATRIRWASYEVMIGAAAGDTTQAEVLVTA